MKKMLITICIILIPSICIGDNESIVNYLYSKYNPLIINGKKINKTDINSILTNVKNQNLDPHPFYVLDTNIRNKKIKINDLKKSGCKFKKDNFMICNLKGIRAEVYLNRTNIVKLIIKYNPKPIFESMPTNQRNKSLIENFTRDLFVEVYNRKNFSNVKYYNVGKIVRVEMDYE